MACILGLDADVSPDGGAWVLFSFSGNRRWPVESPNGSIRLWARGAVADQVTDCSFQGCFHHSLDTKGRIAVPSVFRAHLLEKGVSTIVVTNFICDGARCLEAYSLPDWRRFEEGLKSRGRFDPKVRKLENYYLARAVQCPIDGSGRILIPQNLRDYAGLERDVVFTSSLHGFRLWDRRVWDMIFQEAEAALLEDPALFAEVDTR